jgi:hypothetical protein
VAGLKVNIQKSNVFPHFGNNWKIKLRKTSTYKIIKNTKHLVKCVQRVCMKTVKHSSEKLNMIFKKIGMFTDPKTC